MNKIALALKSRTFWTIVVAVVVNSINANLKFMGPHTVEVVNTVLGLLATIYHVNPSQTYNG